jgi:hypothetical protein
MNVFPLLPILTIPTISSQAYNPHLVYHGGKHCYLEGTSELTPQFPFGSATHKTLLRMQGQSQMDIMLDGFIAQTLAPFCTEKYLNIFMSSLDKQRGSLYVHNNQWLVARPATTQQEKQGCVYETFDHKADLRMGTIVPQPSAIGLSKKTGVLSPTFFTQTNGTLGIPCEFPFPKHYPLHNAKDLAPTVLKRHSQNARIRFSVSTPPFSPSPAGHALGKSQCMYSVVDVYFILFSRFSCSGPDMNNSTTILG